MMNINYRSMLVAGAVLAAGTFSAQAALPDPLWNGPVNFTDTAYMGSYTYDEGTGVMTIKGCGADVWGATDAFYYVYTTQTTNEDFDYFIRVNNFDGESNSWMKAGLMVRESKGYTYGEDGNFNGLDITGGARYFCVQTQKATGSSNTKWITQWRPEEDFAVTDDQSKRYGNYTWPQWLRVRRIGDVYYGIVSSDGVNWEKLWEEDTSKWAGGPLAPPDEYTPLGIGVFVTSHNATSNDATFLAQDFQAYPQTPVEIEHEIQGGEISAGTAYKFEAKVSGYNPFTYVWKKDGKVIAEGTELFGNAFSYKIPTSTLSDSGTYVLEISNTANGVTTTKTTSAKLSVVTDVTPPEVESAQALSNTVGITFNEPVDAATSTVAANYTVNGKTVSSVKQPLSDRITLVLNGEIAAGSEVDVTVKNVKDLSGNTIKDTSLTAKATFAVINNGVPFTKGSAEALGGDGFWLINQGLVNWGTYDEDTFAYKAYTGDFDIRARVLEQSTSTEWARAGLQIRSALDNGKAAAHSSYAEIHHTPVQMMNWDDTIPGYGAPFDNVQGVEQQDLRHSIYSNWRVTNGGDTATGGNTESFLIGGVRTTPLAYTQNDGQLWIRVGRVGNVFNTYYGVEDGGVVTWTRTTSNTLDNFGLVSYGGIHYGIEGNNFGACANLTNEFKNPSVWFHMSTVDFEEGYLEPIELIRSPVSKSLKAPAPLSLSVTATGDPITYQWYKDGAAIEGAIFATYTVDATTKDDAGVYKCEIMNFGSGAPDKGTSVMSAEATVTVEADVTAPTVTSFKYYALGEYIAIGYSEIMDSASVGTVANYIIKNTKGEQIPTTSLVVATDRRSVEVRSTGLTQGEIYTVELPNIKDVSGNLLVYEDLEFGVSTFNAGVTLQYFNYTSGDIADLAAFKTIVDTAARTPDSRVAAQAIESPTNRADYYCTYIHGILLPPETGNYRFAATSDDTCQFYLSTDTNPKNLALQTEQTSWSGAKVYSSGTCTQSGDVYLEAGKGYYFRVYHFEGSGGDSVSVAWSLPSQGPTTIADQTPSIPAAYVLDADQEVNPANTVLEIVKEPPTSVTAYANGSLALPVEVNYSSDLGEDVPPTYVWWVKSDWVSGAWTLVDNANFTPGKVSGATTSTLQFKGLDVWEHTGTYRLDIALAGKNISSSEIQVTVVNDDDPPTAVAVGSNTMEQVTIQFSEQIMSGYEDPANYIIDGLTVLSVDYREDASDTSIVTLITSRQEENKAYNVKFQNITDMNGNSIPASYATPFTGFVWAEGYTYLECFDEAPITSTTEIDWSIAKVVRDWTIGAHPYRAAFPTPLSANYIEITSTTYNQDNCVERVTGYLAPAEDGTYEFAGSCDDSMALYVSNNDSPTGFPEAEEAICWEAGWNSSGARIYDWTGATGTHGSTTIDLKAGQRYYFSALLFGVGGGDFMGFTWRKLPNAMQANGTAPILTGSLLGTYVNPDKANITIEEQPQDQTVTAGSVVSFSVKATTENEFNAPISYQWYINGAAYPGATTNTITLTALPEYNGAQGYCLLTVPGKSVKSHEAKLTVEAASNPVTPILVSGLNNQVVVQFDAPVDPVSGVDIANYQVEGATVKSATTHMSEDTVLLNTEGCEGDSITVTISGVKNLSGVAMPKAVTLKGGYSDMTLTNLDGGYTGVKGYALPMEDCIELYSGAGDFWGAADVGNVFLNEPVTGDFDAVVCINELENSATWAKVGLDFRASLAADSASVSMLATPSRTQATYRPASKLGDTLLSYETYPRITDGAFVETASINYDAVTYPSNWLRLKRVGDKFYAYRSLDGDYWTLVNWGDFTTLGDDAARQMPASGYIGIVYTAQDVNALHKAVISEFQTDYEDPDMPTPDPSDYSMDIVGQETDGVVGFYDYDSEDGLFAIWGCGSDVWGTSDHFTYVRRSVPAGDFSFTARILDFPATANGWAKAGLMVREGTAEGAPYQGSRYVATQTQRSNNPSNTTWRAAYRPELDSNVTDSQAFAGADFVWPQWQRLTREGNAIRGYTSPDGIEWTQYMEIYTGEWIGGDLGSELPLYIGMWVTSHSTTSFDACAFFDNVSFVTGGGGEAPVITQDPQSVNAIVGDSVTFTVKATGTAPLGYQWMKDGSAIVGANAQTFTLSAVELADAGKYSVKVTNSFGVATSKDATLNVSEAPSGEVIAWNVDAAEGQIDLRWSVSSGTTLQTAPTAVGPWTDVTDAEIADGTYLYKVKIGEGSAFFRLIGQ